MLTKKVLRTKPLPNLGDEYDTTPTKAGEYKPHFSEEVRERVLEEDRILHHKEKDRHKMSRYRIEIQFGSKRSARKRSPANIRVWESAQSLEGKGDVSMHFCGNEKCMKPFSGKSFSGGVIVCPHCMGAFNKDDCGSQLGPFVRDMEEICVVVAQLFHALKGDADIVVKWIKMPSKKAIGDITYSMDQVDEHVQRHWDRAVYPYWRLIDDLAAGADMMVLLRAFLA